jgi:hypothetical protein
VQNTYTCTYDLIHLITHNRFNGIRDDLVFLLDEEITSINICTLHCELRNTEQLLRSVGLLSHRIGALDEYNEELNKYSPESFTGKRVVVKPKHGQDSSMAPDRNCIKVLSFSGLFTCI